MKKCDGGKKHHRRVLFLLLKIYLCFPDEIISFVEQMFLESDCQPHTCSESSQDPMQQDLLRTGKTTGSMGFAFQLGLFILQAY